MQRFFGKNELEDIVHDLGFLIFYPFNKQKNIPHTLKVKLSYIK